MSLRSYIILVSSFALAQGILGFFGLSGPTPANSIFGAAWYFDPVENITHTLFGVTGIAIGLRHNEKHYKYFGFALAGTAIVVGIISAFGPVTAGVTLLGAHLQNPGDTLLHLIAGSITLWMSLRTYKTA